MGYSNFISPEEDIKKWLHHIAFICLSEEFQNLKSELEHIYLQSGIKDYRIAAFQDALYTFLAEEEDKNVRQSEAY